MRLRSDRKMLLMAVGGWLVAAVTAPLAVMTIWTWIGSPTVFNPCGLPAWAQIVPAVLVAVLIFGGQAWLQRRDRRKSGA